MSDLSSEARSLVSDGRSMLRPSTADRARVASRLAQRLGASVVLSAQTSFAAPKAPALSALSTVVAALGLLAAGTTYSLAGPEAPPAAGPPWVVAAAHQSAPPASQPCVAAPVSNAVAVDKDDPSPSPVARRAPAADRLGEEVELLSRATSQLRGGNAAAALELLEQHRRLFPAGRLVEERRAARAQALCALGDRGGAQLELTRLAHTAPRSPHVARAQRACGL